jgi:hypothetical protein
LDLASRLGNNCSFEQVFLDASLITAARVRGSADPVVRQLIDGGADGPLPVW